jgi:hypothetical protein
LRILNLSVPWAIVLAAAIIVLPLRQARAPEIVADGEPPQTPYATACLYYMGDRPHAEEICRMQTDQYLAPCIAEIRQYSGTIGFVCIRLPKADREMAKHRAGY